MNIFVLSWHRTGFLSRALENIRFSTDDAHVTVYDNGSDPDEQNKIVTFYKLGFIHTLILDHKNSGCMPPKRIFHGLVPKSEEFYVITDNDFIVGQYWLPRMLDIIRARPRLALLTPQYFPQWPMGPERQDDEVVYCKAVGNTFKLVRRAAVEQVLFAFEKRQEKYSDDSILSELLRADGFEVGFCRNVFCQNLEQGVLNWGYEPHQLKDDPRKSGYGEPMPAYQPKNAETLELPDELKWRFK